MGLQYHRESMLKKILAPAILISAFVPAVAGGISGSFSSFFHLGDGLATWNNLALQLSFAPFELQSLSSWVGPNFAKQSFTLSGDFGNWGFQAGLVLTPKATHLGTFAVQDFQIVGSFVSFEVKLGNVRLSLTIQTGP